MTANRAAFIHARLNQLTDRSKQDFNLTLTRYDLDARRGAVSPPRAPPVERDSVGIGSGSGRDRSWSQAFKEATWESAGLFASVAKSNGYSTSQNSGVKPRPDEKVGRKGKH